MKIGAGGGVSPLQRVAPQLNTSLAGASVRHFSLTVLVFACKRRYGADAFDSSTASTSAGDRLWDAIMKHLGAIPLRKLCLHPIPKIEDHAARPARRSAADVRDIAELPCTGPLLNAPSLTHLELRRGYGVGPGREWTYQDYMWEEAPIQGQLDVASLSRLTELRHLDLTRFHLKRDLEARAKLVPTLSNLIHLTELVFFRLDAHGAFDDACRVGNQNMHALWPALQRLGLALGRSVGVALVSRVVEGLCKMQSLNLLEIELLNGNLQLQSMPGGHAYSWESIASIEQRIVPIARAALVDMLFHSTDAPTVL